MTKCDKYSSDEYFEKMNRFWDVTNYLAVGQLYLLDNPLLERKLKREDIKRKIVGHWGTVPGQNFVYLHCNRVINKYDLNMIYISGPGHGGNFFVANAYLEGTYSEVYPKITQDKEGLKKLFKQFSFPCGISSHVAPEVPGSMHEGGELGYSLVHGFGAVLDNPDLIATVVVGDGEAETGTLATSWHGNKFLNTKNDGAVLPILHLNGFKISNPTVLSRISEQELIALFYGYGWEPILVEGDDPSVMHREMAEAMDTAIEKIKSIQNNARQNNVNTRPLWPMIILRTPKGWTCPKVVDNVKIEGSFNSHQVPISMNVDSHVELLENWLKSYHSEKCFDSCGRLLDELKELTPKGNKRMSANPITNGGEKQFDLKLPQIKDFEVKISQTGITKTQDMAELGKYLAKVFELNDENKNFRMFSPDEMKSNRLNSVFDVTKRQFEMPITADDENLSHYGRVIDSFLSENFCEGLLEAYNLTGRHGIFASYEAFARVVDSMVSQHIKWITVCNEIKWRKKIPSLNLILTSNVWQQDHNGFTHQDPGMIDHVCDKKGNVGRIYLPPDANCLISCMEHCLQTKNYVNLLVTSKHPSRQWLSMDEAMSHCKAGIGVWDFASNNQQNADFVIACCGATPTIEAVECAKLVKQFLPTINFRFVNVVDLMRLESEKSHPHGLSDADFDQIFTTDKPVIFAYHGYPKLIHELIYKRHNALNFHVAGYRENGAITTAFDMRVLNKIDRYHLALMLLDNLDLECDDAKQKLVDYCNTMLIKHKSYIAEFGEDMPETKD